MMHFYLFFKLPPPGWCRIISAISLSHATLLEQGSWVRQMQPRFTLVALDLRHKTPALTSELPHYFSSHIWPSCIDLSGQVALTILSSGTQALPLAWSFTPSCLGALARRIPCFLQACLKAPQHLSTYPQGYQENLNQTIYPNCKT